MGRSERIAIVGAGIGGLSLAIALQRKGFLVNIFESAPVIKPIGAGLGLAGNAIKAFEAIGIHDQVVSAGSILKRLTIKDERGNVLAETDSEKISRQYNVVNNFTIHRADLHAVLLKNITPGSLQLGKSCVDFTQTSKEITIKFSDGSTTSADFVVACDGIRSVFRTKLLPKSRLRYAGYTCWRAVISNVPATVNLDETSESWGAGARFGIVPVNDRRLYWFACLNAPENNAAMRKYTIQDLLRHFGHFHSPIPEILKSTTDDQLIWSDIHDVEPVDRFAFNNILLLGDAAHATTPNMGQGACMAIEDAATLANLMANGRDIVAAFSAFEKKRIKRTTTIVNDSWRLGKVAQWQNPIAIKMRNALLKITPPSVAAKQVQFLQDVTFE